MSCEDRTEVDGPAHQARGRRRLDLRHGGGSSSEDSIKRQITSEEAFPQELVDYSQAH